MLAVLMTIGALFIQDQSTIGELPIIALEWPHALETH